MPVIKVDHVVSFSSEDPNHVANNLLLSDPAKKWKCKSPGERQATIVLQLEKASVISAIDIGNETSAYIEVLVGRSSTIDDYKVLLVMSSFMSPLEARQTINTNKVRMFTQDQLSKPECDEKWDRIKIVCSQVFNRRVQYGLSFVTFHSPDDKNKARGPPVQTTLGGFTLRPPSPDDLSVGSLFAKRKEIQSPLTGAAAIRQASTSESLSQNGSPVCKPKLKDYQAPKTPRNGNNSKTNDGESKAQPRNRKELLYDLDDDKPNKKIDKLIEEKLKEADIKNKLEDTTKLEKKPKDSPKRKDLNPPSTSKRKSSTSARNNPKKVKKSNDNQRKSFNQLLSGVTLVISGIQNPDRADLRSKALALGAKYKPDWDKSCSHLICAFPNTPKFREVKGKGKIVKKEWILECHSQRKRLPWRRFALDSADQTKDESEDEILEEIEKPQNSDNVIIDDDDDSSDHDGYDDTKMQAKIAEILAKQKQDTVKPTKPTPFSTDTEDEAEIISSPGEISDTLPDFFNNKTFFIDETLDEDIYKMIKRYIIAYKGKIDENPTNTVDIIISTEATADTIKDTNTHSTYLTPDWIWECHNNKKLIPTHAYTL